MRQKVFFLKCSDMPVWIHFIYLRSILENVFCLKCSQTPCLELPSWYFYLCHKDAVSHNKQIGCNFKSWFSKILCGLWPTPIVLLPVAPARNLCSDQKTHWWQSLRFPRMSKTTLEMLQLFSLSLQKNIHLMNFQKGTVLWKKMLKQVVLAEGLAKSHMVPNVCHMMPAGLTGGEG